MHYYFPQQMSTRKSSGSKAVEDEVVDEPVTVLSKLSRRAAAKKVIPQEESEDDEEEEYDESEEEEFNDSDEEYAPKSKGKTPTKGKATPTKAATPSKAAGKAGPSGGSIELLPQPEKHGWYERMDGLKTMADNLMVVKFTPASMTDGSYITVKTDAKFFRTDVTKATISKYAMYVLRLMQKHGKIINKQGEPTTKRVTKEYCSEFGAQQFKIGYNTLLKKISEKAPKKYPFERASMWVHMPSLRAPVVKAAPVAKPSSTDIAARLASYQAIINKMTEDDGDDYDDLGNSFIGFGSDDDDYGFGYDDDDDEPKMNTNNGKYKAHLSDDMAQAAFDGDLADVKRLIKAKANPNAYACDDPHGRTALQVAWSEGHQDVVDFLLNNGADHEHGCIDRADRLGDMLGMGDLKSIKEYVEKRGANIHYKCYDEEINYLQRASQTPRLDIVKYFVSKGLDPNDKCAEGKNALDYAAESGTVEVAKYLISIKADVNNKDEEGSTPLQKAIESGNVDMVKCMVDGKADCIVMSDNTTPLQFAETRKNKNDAIIAYLTSLKPATPAKTTPVKAPAKATTPAKATAPAKTTPNKRGAAKSEEKDEDVVEPSTKRTRTKKVNVFEY